MIHLRMDSNAFEILQVEKVEFVPQDAQIRVSGTNSMENEWVKVRAFCRLS